jgi:hypothetical protein
VKLGRSRDLDEIIKCTDLYLDRLREFVLRGSEISFSNTKRNLSLTQC